MMKDYITKQINHLDNWFEKSDFKGIDIYDLYDIPIFHSALRIKPILLRKIMRKFLSFFIKNFPGFLVNRFNIKKNINPKSLGLIIKAYCNLFEYTQDIKYLEKAKGLSGKVFLYRSKKHRFLSWGYPFNWTSKIFIPKDTASGVVSCTIGDAFHSLYELSNEELYLNHCIEICEFLSKELNIDNVDSDKICFSYTPIDSFHVNNANLLVAEFLLRIGYTINEKNYINLGQKALNYSLNLFEKDGSLSYWAKENNNHNKWSRSKNDHYHIGFELRSLLKIYNLNKNPELFNCISNYYKYYLNNFVSTDFVYLYKKKKYPINIHACSEFIILNAAFLPYDFSINKKRYHTISKKILDTMLDKKDNLYIFEIRKFIFFRIKTSFKFFRWSEAWMFLSLSELLKTYTENE